MVKAPKKIAVPEKTPAQFAVDLLKSVDLSIEDRSLLTACVLETLAALPLHDIIKVDTDGTLMVNGEYVELEQAKKLRESARVALGNYAFNFIRDQVTFEGIKTGFLQADSEKQSFFGKAAIWWGQQEIKFLMLLAQTGSVEDSE